jgi:hypothetical protein
MFSPRSIRLALRVFFFGTGQTSLVITGGGIWHVTSAAQPGRKRAWVEHSRSVSGECEVISKFCTCGGAFAIASSEQALIRHLATCKRVRPS